MALSDNIKFILIVILLANGIGLIGSLMQWLFLVLCRVPVTEMYLFHGPKILRFQMRSTCVQLGCLPMGSGLSFDVETFHSRPFAVRLATCLVGFLTVLLIAVLLLGAATAWHHVGTGFYQIPFGALHWRTEAITLIDALQTTFNASFGTGVGIVAAKIISGSFLPLGGPAVAECIRHAFAFPGHRGAEVFTVISLCLSLGIQLFWFLACVQYALFGSA